MIFCPAGSSALHTPRGKACALLASLVLVGVWGCLSRGDACARPSTKENGAGQVASHRLAGDVVLDGQLARQVASEVAVLGDKDGDRGLLL